jgi:hypothetical protein
MPIKGMSPKGVMKTEMHKFKAGTLHSGSKSGPKVKSRKQAVAIGMSEARKRPGLGGPDPIERSVAAADVALPHQVAGRHYDGGFVEYLPRAAQNVDKAPKKHGPYPAPLNPTHRLVNIKEPAYEPWEPPTHHVERATAHGYGHRDGQQHGHLRMSGDSRAHQIGKR